MSLFDEIQWTIIENPRATWSAQKIRKQTDEIKKPWKELRKEMKETLSEDEFKKWYNHQTYERFKYKYQKSYQKIKEDDAKLMKELLKEIDEETPEPINYDKYYTEKFRNDDVKSNWYRFAWRSSRLWRLDWRFVPKQRMPFRVVKVRWMERGMRDMNEIQNKAYEYIKPHMGEFKNEIISLQKKQRPYDYPVYRRSYRLEEFAKAGPVNPWHIYLVFDAMQRWKYIASETYLWKNSFIFGDVVVTQTGKLFRISLENNLPWLTKDTVEDIHKLRIDWRKNKWKVAPPIYLLNDAYLIKIKPNERETLFYIVPT